MISLAAKHVKVGDRIDGHGTVTSVEHIDASAFSASPVVRVKTTHRTMAFPPEHRLNIHRIDNP